MNSPDAGQPPDFTRGEFDKFLHAYTHAIRNRLNSIALEAADLAEQAGADSARLQQQIQECSALLKAVRETLAPDEGQTPRASLADMTRKLRGPST